MAKQTIRSVLVFIGIVSIVPMCNLAYGLIVGSQLVRGMMPLADGLATANAWLDSNANGVPDPGEQPLPNVCVWGSYSPEGAAVEPDTCGVRTDGGGGWGQFLPGGRCDQFFVAAKPPDGYHATTDLMLIGCDAKFGFVQESVPVNHRVLSIDDYIKKRNTDAQIREIAIALIVLIAGVLGTIWLDKTP